MQKVLELLSQLTTQARAPTASRADPNDGPSDESSSGDESPDDPTHRAKSSKHFGHERRCQELRIDKFFGDADGPE